MKYRVWTKKHGWISNTAICTPDGTVLSLACEVDEKTQMVTWRVHNLAELNPVIQQFTGVLDEGGKEIYDGDLIKGNGYGPYRVFEDKGAWCSCCYSDSEPIGTYNRIEVVGNIFDNPNYEGQQ